MLHYLFYYTEWRKSQYKRTEQISLQWHGFECNREFLESKFYSLRFPCPFGKPTFFSRESSFRKQYRTTSKGLRLEIRMEKKKKEEEKIFRNNEQTRRGLQKSPKRLQYRMREIPFLPFLSKTILQTEKCKKICAKE